MVGQDPTSDQSCVALDLVETQFAWLLLWDKNHGTDGGAAFSTPGMSAFNGGPGLQAPTTPRSVIPVGPCSLAWRIPLSISLLLSSLCPPLSSCPLFAVSWRNGKTKFPAYAVPSAVWRATLAS
jgi:hypothetical protein